MVQDQAVLKRTKASPLESITRSAIFGTKFALLFKGETLKKRVCDQFLNELSKGSNFWANTLVELY